MRRRQFLALSALAFASSATRAEGGKFVDYSPEAYEKALASGEPFLLDFWAKW